MILSDRQTMARSNRVDSNPESSPEVRYLAHHHYAAVSNRDLPLRRFGCDVEGIEKKVRVVDLDALPASNWELRWEETVIVSSWFNVHRVPIHITEVGTKSPERQDSSPRSRITHRLDSWGSLPKIGLGLVQDFRCVIGFKLSASGLLTR